MQVTNKGCQVAPDAAGLPPGSGCGSRLQAAMPTTTSNQKHHMCQHPLGGGHKGGAHVDALGHVADELLRQQGTGARQAGGAILHVQEQERRR